MGIGSEGGNLNEGSLKRFGLNSDIKPIADGYIIVNSNVVSLPEFLNYIQKYAFLESANPTQYRLSLIEPTSPTKFLGLFYKNSSKQEYLESLMNSYELTEFPASPKYTESEKESIEEPVEKSNPVVETETTNKSDIDAIYYVKFV